MVGVACLGTPGSVSAATTETVGGFWVSIASGVAGSSTATGYQDLWFETPHGPPPVAVTRLSGSNVEATTGGGSSFFTNGAVPVVLPTTDGYAYLAGGAKPGDLSDALKRQTSGGQGLASGPPDATATAPPGNAVLLSADLSDPDANGTRSLTVTVTDGQSNPLGSGTVTVPDGGWWVIGLGPGPNEVPTPGGGNDGGGNGGPVATPEPATGMLFGIGGLGAAGWRLAKRRRVN